MPKTRRGVYHNLKESDYTVSDDELETVFFFSSRFRMNKFLEGYKNNRRKLYERIERSIKDPDLNLDLYADIHFYNEVEINGFYVWLKGVSVEWQEIKEYALWNVTNRNTKDYEEIPKPKLDERKRIME